MTPHHPHSHPFARRSAAFVAAVLLCAGVPFVAVALAEDPAADEPTASRRSPSAVATPPALTELGSDLPTANSAANPPGIVAQIGPETAAEIAPAPSPQIAPRPEVVPEIVAEVVPEVVPEEISAAIPEMIEAPAIVAEDPAATAVRLALATLTDTYAWDERSERVVALQTVLGVTADGWYGHATLRAHRNALENAGLPTAALPVPPVPAGPSPSQWAALRECESNGNYSITNPSGRYRGAYQFDRRTWDGVASRHAPHLAGVDPAAAAPADQDAMALALYSERGAQPWPHCGRHLR